MVANVRGTLGPVWNAEDKAGRLEPKSSDSTREIDK